MASNPFASLEWRSIGPHRGGRVVAVAGHPTERGTFYFGGCAGGQRSSVPSQRAGPTRRT